MAALLLPLKISVFAAFAAHLGALVHGSVAVTALTCAANSRSATVIANTTWQSIRVSSPIGHGDCTTYVDLPNSSASQTEPPHPPPPPLLLLLKIDSLQLVPPGSSCVYNDTTLTLYLRDTSSARTPYVCSTGASAEWYMWTNESLKVYLYVPENPSATTSPSFALAFVTASATNVCNTRNGSLETTVDDELYVFAPDKRYSAIPPNDAPCSDYNYTMTIAPANASSQLSLFVLAAPWKGGCRVLLVNGSRGHDNDTYHAEVGEPMKLTYELAPYCSKSGTFDAFTIRVNADAGGGGQIQQLQSTTASVSSGKPSASAFYSDGAADSSSSAIPEMNAGASTGNGSPSVSVVAGASAAAGVTAIGLLTGLTFVVVVRRRRRQSRLPSKRANSPGVRGAQPPLHGDEAPSDYGQQQYSLYEGSPVCDRRSSAVARSSSEGRTQAPPLSRGHQFPTESEIHMVDNDLYGTAFGS